VDWNNHPRIATARAGLASRFRGKAYAFKHLDPVVLLCGASKSHLRDNLARYLRRHCPEIRFFYAEAIWEQISRHERLTKSKRNRLSALEMENELGQVSDLLIVIVESPGTFAELGAFSLSDDLRKKLLPILDKQHEEEPSFVNTGPVMWANRDSLYGPAIYADFEVFVDAMGEVEARLKKIPRRGPLGEDFVSDPSQNPKHLLLLLCDLIAVIGPATQDQCAAFLEDILRKEPIRSIGSLLGLATSLGLVRCFSHDGLDLYYRPLVDGAIAPFMRQRRMFDLNYARAAFVSVLQTIEPARAALDSMGPI
jgi:hypothetical protein